LPPILFRCLFWELDEDEDSLLQKDDLLRYGSYGFSARVVDRVWTLRRDTSKEGMTYDDFVYFLLAEEDKQSQPALQYWFHILDFDSDGFLDARDMWYFYEELQSRLEAMDEEVIPFSELANELFDLVAPAVRGRIKLSELKRCQLGFNFVSALTNVRKYIAWEGLSCEKAAGRASNLRDTRDWDLFADSEYRRLVETEDEGGGNEGGGNGDGAPDDAGGEA
jgi:serine/threonine-protein phosphatase 2A regulatory subunit B''